MGPDAHYTIFEKDGNPVSALAQMDKPQQEMGLPSHWLSYVSTANVDASVEKAKQLGGTVVAGPFDVMEHGRMAVLQDPTGAAIALWQAKAHPGATRLDQPYSLVWTELMTNDPKKSQAFYTGLFEWGTEVMPMGTFDYTLWKRGTHSAGGMMQIQPEMGPMPPHWMPYFGVENADATAKKAKDLGGKAMVEPQDIPNVGRFAVLVDPTGGHFSILQPAPGMDKK
jgi:predicted enzyme related to lactoylglutathione lyase